MSYWFPRIEAAGIPVPRKIRTMRLVFGVIQTPPRASVTIYQNATSNFSLRSALAYAMPAHAPVLVVRRTPQHRQLSETLSCQIAKLAHLSFLFGSRLTKVRKQP